MRRLNFPTSANDPPRSTSGKGFCFVRAIPGLERWDPDAARANQGMTIVSHSDGGATIVQTIRMSLCSARAYGDPLTAPLSYAAATWSRAGRLTVRAKRRTLHRDST